MVLCHVNALAKCNLITTSLISSSFFLKVLTDFEQLPTISMILILGNPMPLLDHFAFANWINHIWTQVPCFLRWI